MIRGVRARITTVATVAVLAVLALAAVALLAMQERVLTDNLDESLELQVEELAARYRSGSTGGALLVPRGDDDAFEQIVSDDGELLAWSRVAADLPALPGPPPGADRSIRTARVFPDEPRYRISSLRAGDLVFHVAAPIDDIAESVTVLRWGLSLAIPFVTGLLAALVWWLVGRTLRPVEAIRREVADINGGTLDRRVPVPTTGDEVEQLARTMNDMLERVEVSSERQRRFVADASHELRSPLTRIRTELEVDLAHPATADHGHTHLSVLEEAGRLERLVDDLLLLARHDAGGPVAQPRAVELDALVESEVLRRPETAPVRFDATGVTPARVIGDPAQLARAVRNLLDNAEHHARNHAAIRLRAVDHLAVLCVDDDGPGVPPAAAVRIFERFTRLDDARAAVDGGSGLGLAIVRDIVARHGGTVRVEEGPLGGARFVVELPLAREDESANR